MGREAQSRESNRGEGRRGPRSMRDGSLDKTLAQRRQRTVFASNEVAQRSGGI